MNSAILITDEFHLMTINNVTVQLAMTALPLRYKDKLRKGKQGG